MKINIFIGILVLTCSAVTFAQPDESREKEEIVASFYQAYFGPPEYCKAADPNVVLAIKLTFDSLELRYPREIKLVRDSPYFSQAKSDFERTELKIDVKNINSWCSGVHEFMKLLFDGTETPALMADLVDTLSK
jgi:hypothetical protein